MQPTKDALLPNQTILLKEKASKLQRNVNFILGFCLPIQYYYGEFIGDA